MYAGFRLWTQRGILEHIFTSLREAADMEHFSTDSTFCKVHQSANGAEKTEYQAVGVSNGGRNTKIHAIVDGPGNPVSFLLNSGNNHDAGYAIALPGQIEIRGSNIPADKAYQAKAIRNYIFAREAGYTIPSKINDPNPWPVDWHTDRECHLIECFFQKFKWFCRVFTRYDKLDASFLAFVLIAAIAILLI